MFQKAPDQKDKFLTEFLKKNVPKKFHKDFTGEADLKYQRMSLLGARKEKKKLGDFLRTRAKRKQLTAREKRDLKLFEIKPKEQK